MQISIKNLWKKIHNYLCNSDTLHKKIIGNISNIIVMIVLYVLLIACGPFIFNENFINRNSQYFKILIFLLGKYI